jgi:hypothetical protein
MAVEIFRRKVGRVELLVGYEGNEFASTGDITEDLLSITAVHPLRDDAVQARLDKCGADFAVVQSMIDHGELTRAERAGHSYYLRTPAQLRAHPTELPGKTCDA